MLINLIIIGAVILGLLFQALILYQSSKLSKVPNTTFFVSFKITIASIICGLAASLILGFLAALIGVTQKYIFYIIGAIVGFYIFHVLMKKYYQTSVLKNLIVYLVQVVIGVLISIFLVATIVYFRATIGEPFAVAGNAMNPNFTNGQYILLNKTDKNYKRGDVIVHKFPKDPSQFFLKRIIGLPGEKVNFSGGYVFINGTKLEEAYLAIQGNTYIPINTKEIKLDVDEYFVLGDNRVASSDSRIWGPVPKNLIVGKYWKKVEGK